jgi:HemY protein
MAGREDAAFLGLRGLFRQAMAREDWSGAAALARQAEAAYPGAAWLREERTELAVRIGDWGHALALAGPDSPRSAYATAAAESAVDPERGLALAKRAWRDDRGFAPAALGYATRLRAAGKEKAAFAVVAESWGEAPNPGLAAFALAPVHDKLARVAAATRLVEGSPEHAESHFLLARENFAAGLTGEARRHAEAARRAGMRQRRLYLLLGELAAAEGNTEAQRDALLEAANAEPDPAWRCEACGAVHAAWHPACPSCHTPGRIAWGGPTWLAIAAD